MKYKYDLRIDNNKIKFKMKELPFIEERRINAIKDEREIAQGIVIPHQKNICFIVDQFNFCSISTLIRFYSIRLVFNISDPPTSIYSKLSICYSLST